jgi:hypothetical protein
VWLTVHSPEIPLPNGNSLLDALELNWDFNGCPNIPRQVSIEKSLVIHYKVINTLITIKFTNS